MIFFFKSLIKQNLSYEPLDEIEDFIVLGHAQYNSLTFIYKFIPFVSSYELTKSAVLNKFQFI